MDAEQKLISSLSRLKREWPKGYWLFANGVNLYLMKTHPDGSRHDKSGAMDQSLIVESFDIPNDGGDW